MYTVSSRSNFPIAQNDADLWLMDLKTRRAAPVERGRRPWPTVGELHHNWSSNSRWFVFSSKREDSMYTKLYLAHISADEEGLEAFPAAPAQSAEILS